MIGHIVWDFAGEEWVTDISLLRCFELLASDPQLRKGRLGKDSDQAQDIAMEVAVAWESSVAPDSSGNFALLIPKLDTLDSKGAMELFPSYRPSVDILPHV